MNLPESRAAINFFLPSEFTPSGRSFSAPIQDVIPHPTDRRSGCSRHAMSVNRARRQVNKALSHRQTFGCSRHAMSVNRARRQVNKALCPPLALTMSPFGPLLALATNFFN